MKEKASHIFMEIRDWTKNGHKLSRYILAVIFAVFVVTMVGVLMYKSGLNKIYMSDYISAEYTGANGYASARFIVDTEKLYNRIASKENDENKKLRYKAFCESVNATTNASDISNGDRIQVEVNYDESIMSEENINIAEGSYSLKVKGIGQGEKINLFENVEVVFKGVSPCAGVEVNNRWEDQYLSSLDFEADKADQIKKNDLITISCKSDAQELARHGYVADKTTLEFNADKLSEYPSGVELLDSAVLKKVSEQNIKTIETQTEDATFRMMYKATGDSAYLRKSNSEKAEAVQLKNVYFLSAKDSNNQENNYIYLLYKATIDNQETKSDVYFAFGYDNVYITVDNQFIITDKDAQNQYICATDYDKLYQDLINAKEADYNINECSSIIND